MTRHVDQHPAHPASQGALTEVTNETQHRFCISHSYQGEAPDQPELEMHRTIYHPGGGSGDIQEGFREEVMPESGMAE